MCRSYIFSVRADVVCRLRVVSTFGQPFADGCTVCGRVVHLTAFKTATGKRYCIKKQHKKLVGEYHSIAA